MDEKTFLQALRIAEVMSAPPCSTRDVGKYVIVRAFSAGAFAGTLEARNGMEVVLCNARRLWKWRGAASLSELAQRGTSAPTECMFPVAVDRVMLTQAIEILDVTEAGRKSIEGVPVWTR